MAVTDACPEGPATAAAGTAMHAIAMSPRSTGDRSRPTGREATHSPGRRQGSGRQRAQDSSVGVPRLTSLLRVCAGVALVPMTTKPPPMRTRGELPLRTTGRIIALMAAMAAFALGPGSAFAPAQVVLPGSAARCDTLASTADPAPEGTQQPQRSSGCSPAAHRQREPDRQAAGRGTRAARRAQLPASLHGPAARARAADLPAALRWQRSTASSPAISTSAFASSSSRARRIAEPHDRRPSLPSVTGAAPRSGGDAPTRRR